MINKMLLLMMIYETADETMALQNSSTNPAIPISNNIDPLVCRPLSPPMPPNPIACIDLPSRIYVTPLLPGQVVWNQIRDKLPTLRHTVPIHREQSEVIADSLLSPPPSISVSRQDHGNNSTIPTTMRASHIALNQETVPQAQIDIIQAQPLLNTQEQLQQAQVIWAEMFRTSQESNATDGHRPIILSVENQRANKEWGDPLQGKSDQITRLYGMNVNGLRLDKRGGQLDELCKVMKEVQADVFCGQEHNLDSDKTQVRQILYHTTRQHWKRSRVTFGTTPIAFS